MKVNMGLKVLPVDERGKVALETDLMNYTLSPESARLIARELLSAARRAEKLETKGGLKK